MKFGFGRLKIVYRNKKYLFLVLMMFLGLKDVCEAQRSWDYSWGYSSTMEYYSNKVLKNRSGTDSLKKHKPYVMFPHAGKTTYDNNEEKVSDFKLWQIAIEALKEVQWDKLGLDNPYKARDSAIHMLMEDNRKAISFHDSILKKFSLPVNDLAVTWGLGLALGDEINTSIPLGKVNLNNRVAACRKHLTETEVINKTNYEKCKDKIRLVDLGIRPYLQYRSTTNLAQKNQAKVAMEKFVEDFSTK